MYFQENELNLGHEMSSLNTSSCVVSTQGDAWFIYADILNGPSMFVYCPVFVGDVCPYSVSLRIAYCLLQWSVKVLVTDDKPLFSVMTAS